MGGEQVAFLAQCLNLKLRCRQVFLNLLHARVLPCIDDHQYGDGDQGCCNNPDGQPDQCLDAPEGNHLAVIADEEHAPLPVPIRSRPPPLPPSVVFTRAAHPPGLTATASPRRTLK